METVIGQLGYKLELGGLFRLWYSRFILNNVRIYQKVENIGILVLGTRIVTKIQSRSDDQVIWSLIHQWGNIAAFSIALPLWSFNYSVSTSLLLSFAVLLIIASVYCFFLCVFWLLPAHPFHATHSQRPSILSVSHSNSPRKKMLSM